MVRTLPIEARHAVRVATLPSYHRDPFDRLLVAQAEIERLPIVTADPRFGAYGVEVLPL
jgi:PIN domain nuclease of toxin-antitoxin system